MHARQRILDAALAEFTRRGYAKACTLAIATRARVSKRDLYALVGKKEDMLLACIRERAQRFRLPANLPEPTDRTILEKLLATFGTRLLHEVTDPAVIALFRLAIAEATRAPEVAQTLNGVGRGSSRAILGELLKQARDAALVEGDTTEQVESFLALLWGNLMLDLLLGTSERPDETALAQRARHASDAFLRLYPAPDRPPTQK
ncbi:TetR family transcriptional regulator [Halothiobacillus diazotrophicus]|uniref:TetR family transcriptional regulator n=1 Tax=Halothiobacillus diazotrophicus TaxID=1860122 RepID=A0A191ZKS5_9GAMM|nr:TetR family transcriptional regulator [Halothiobacillus diazotrophicus]